MAPKSLDLTPVPYRFLHSQLAKPIPVPKDTSLAGATAIVTGANSGLGFQCALDLLALGLSRLIIAVRTPSKGEEAAAKLRQRFKSATVEVWRVDMLSHESVQAFAAKCERLDRIDFVILNAGAIEEKFKMGPEGHEVMFQVNYLSTVLLSTLLLPVLKRKAPSGSPGRLTIVNSGTALVPKFPDTTSDQVLQHCDDESKFDVLDSYARTKALAHFWIVKLAERVSAKDVVVNLVDPGLVKGTDLHRNVNPIVRVFLTAIKSLTGRTMEQGASTFINAAVVRGEETHGSYLMDWVIFPYNMEVYGPNGETLRDRIWTETLKALSFVDIDGILSSVSL
ncbi:hypothetical protein B0J13DRAFT_620954 [Dactylonectria estremocensis]|uniref:Uncharacterized protein n=1 Tax=Dactylonectria estremocensis TaxID=1079267 RepID=A0A9P9EWB6_9HYPO|nr:hypothetical protein B0J13DRAFT_620954 [Dactylonectria estremocensis]